MATIYRTASNLWAVEAAGYPPAVFFTREAAQQAVDAHNAATAQIHQGQAVQGQYLSRWHHIRRDQL
jgi:hypothetical protein